MLAAATALKAGKPELAYDLTEKRDEIDWPFTSNAGMRLARAAVDFVEADRLIGEGEFQTARARLEAVTIISRQNNGSERLGGIIDSSLKAISDRLDAAVADAAEPPD